MGRFSVCERGAAFFGREVRLKLFGLPICTFSGKSTKKPRAGASSRHGFLWKRAPRARQTEVVPSERGACVPAAGAYVLLRNTALHNALRAR